MKPDCIKTRKSLRKLENEHTTIDSASLFKIMNTEPTPYHKFGRHREPGRSVKWVYH